MADTLFGYIDENWPNRSLDELSTDRTEALPPAARNSDPLTSHLASAENLATGLRGKQCKKVLEALSTFEKPPTGRELAAFMDDEAAAEGHVSRTSAFSVTHKRLPDLRHMGRVANGPPRRCHITGRPALTWFIIGIKANT
jgi:hypothetical protein